MLDLSTGAFRDDFARDADDFVRTAVDAAGGHPRSVAAWRCSRSRDGEGVVLVAASSKVTNAGGAGRSPAVADEV